ncbi:hypothetical protein GCM10007301_22840 [Azorhizobium oxalatiphilum]|uniref:Uncharacterized protein n=1 Tax=Azorhizobium oxalatiphilum TaxID=980631 RepID=A0A917F9H9_9HYPH|nr:hypothetical protein [Azorhizobium oxalatiphilum]GGF62546.1 hypothetical protein GCM10007301_22840 [Azorhizobium oxalatiphilum]
MSYAHAKMSNRIRAKSLLESLKLRLSDAHEAKIEEMSGTTDPLPIWWRLSKVDGVHIYSTPEGWFTDIVFKGLPSEVPDICGSTEPTPSRQDAIFEALGLLAAFAKTDLLPLPPEEKAELLWFKFDDIEVPVLAASILPWRQELMDEGYTVERARRRLAFLRDQACGERALTKKVFSRLSEIEQKQIEICCAIAMAMGLPRFSIEDGVLSDFERDDPAPRPH